MRRTQTEWLEEERQEQRQRVEDVTEARLAIARARTRYQRAQDAGKDMTGVTPERVLSVADGFREMCKTLNNERTWKMLSRKERAFIADAVEFAKKRTR